MRADYLLRLIKYMYRPIIVHSAVVRELRPTRSATYCTYADLREAIRGRHSVSFTYLFLLQYAQPRLLSCSFCSTTAVYPSVIYEFGVVTMIRLDSVVFSVGNWLPVDSVAPRQMVTTVGGGLVRRS